MAQIQNRAILLNIGAFIADNNIRRSVAAFTHNYMTSDGSADVSYLTIQPGDTKTYITNGNKVLLIETTSLVSAEITLAALTLPSTRGAVSYLTFIAQALLIDDAVTQVAFTNPGTTPLQVTILKG